MTVLKVIEIETVNKYNSCTLLPFDVSLQVVFFSGPTRILLGTAVMLQAGVILRYVSYFKKFNVSFQLTTFA